MAARGDEALHGGAEGLLEHADGDVVLGGGDECECLHESVEVFTVLQVTRRRGQGRGDRARSVDL